MGLTRRGFIATVLAGWGSAFLQACGYDNELSAEVDEAPNGWRPAYEKLEEAGEFADRVEEALSRLENCQLCPHRCGADRRAGQMGFCRATARATVHSHQAHFGEELPLVGRNGSGTIFFSHCNLRCVFCQNWPIAHEGRGREVSDERLADMMLDMQRRGCHNVNLVTPTHMMPNIVSATRIALRKGLRIPLCYNTGGYELVENIELLDGIVDIYLPDLKFMDGDQAERYAFTHAGDYPERAREAIAEMHRQVGELQTDGDGIALRGLMVRHLVMPNRVSGTREFVRWVAENLTPSTYVNIMSQYRVEHRAFEHPEIARAITPQEFLEAMQWAEEAGLTNLDSRSVSQRDLFRRRLGRG